jgi:hypothetical protein
MFPTKAGLMWLGLAYYNLTVLTKANPQRCSVFSRALELRRVNERMSNEYLRFPLQPWLLS